MNVRELSGKRQQRLSLILGMLVFFLLLVTPSGFLAAELSKGTETAIGTISGSGMLLRATASERIQVTEKPMPVFAADRVILVSAESSTFRYPDGRTVKFAGEGEYVPQATEIKIIRGGVTVSFSSSPKGYKIRLPSATLGIRGTVLHIKVLKNMEAVWVAEGIIDWKNNKTGEKRVLKQGEGMKVEISRASPIANTPLKIVGPATAQPKTQTTGEAPSTPGNEEATPAPTSTPEPPPSIKTPF